MKIKSFFELSKVLNRTPFSQYKELDREGREEFLLKYGIRTDKEYEGQYNKYKHTVTINELTNPFTGDVLTVELLEDKGIYNHGDLLSIRIIPATTEGNCLTEDNVLFCERVKSAEEIREKMLQRKKERELEKKRKEEEQRREKEEELKKKKEAEERAKERARLRELERQKAEKKRLQLQQFLDERKIRQLVHFTQLDNLDSILENGILPRKELDGKSFKGLVNDAKRLDGCKDCSCFSVEYPNMYLLDRYKVNSRGARWVMLILSADLLIEHTNYFANYNAGSNQVRYGLRDCDNIKDFEAMFKEELHVYTYNGSRHYTREPIKEYSYLPTSDQAEILVQGIVGIDKIQIIYFQNEEDKQQFENDKRCEEIELLVNPLIFEKHREDYRFFNKR